MIKSGNTCKFVSLSRKIEPLLLLNENIDNCLLNCICLLKNDNRVWASKSSSVLWGFHLPLAADSRHCSTHHHHLHIHLLLHSLPHLPYLKGLQVVFLLFNASVVKFCSSFTRLMASMQFVFSLEAFLELKRRFMKIWRDSTGRKSSSF